MNNPRLAHRYAKSLIDISKEMGQLEAVFNDIGFMEKVVKSSKEFLVMLNSPVIPGDKKYKVIAAVMGDRISNITDAFIRLLCKKNRENNLPGIITAFKKQYHVLKGIHTATLTTAMPVSDALIGEFESMIKAASDVKHLQLQRKVDESLIGGFVLEMEGKLVDASISRDLNDVRKQFESNEYMHRLR